MEKDANLGVKENGYLKLGENVQLFLYSKIFKRFKSKKSVFITLLKIF